MHFLIFFGIAREHILLSLQYFLYVPPMLGAYQFGVQDIWFFNFDSETLIIDKLSLPSIVLLCFVLSQQACIRILGYLGP